MNEDWENELEKKELPDIECFQSSLSNTKCSVNNYNYPKEVHKLFGCKKIKDYNNLYVKTDVFLLAEAYASYRKNSYISFGLHPIHCISAHGFSNRAMLKMTNIKIKVITNSNIHLIIEKGIRGGRGKAIYYHAQANNKYLILILIKIKTKNHI